MVNITKATESYIRQHPYIQLALKNGILNYSKLARKIGKETGIQSRDAVIIAARRYFERIRDRKGSSEVTSLLSGTRISVRDKIAVLILGPRSRLDSLIDIQKRSRAKNEAMHIVHSPNAITLIITEDLLDYARKEFEDILRVSDRLVEITLKSPVRLESVPGVLGHIYALFAENDVNILETSSCWTDTILVIRKEDLAKALSFLNF